MTRASSGDSPTDVIDPYGDEPSFRDSALPGTVAPIISSVEASICAVRSPLMAVQVEPRSSDRKIDWAAMYTTLGSVGEIMIGVSQFQRSGPAPPCGKPGRIDWACRVIRFTRFAPPFCDSA